MGILSAQSAEVHQHAGTHTINLLMFLPSESTVWLFLNVYFHICWSSFELADGSKLFLNDLTLRNVYFSGGRELIASHSDSPYCLYNVSLFRVSLSAMSLPLHHSCFHLRCFPASCLYCMEALGEKIPACDFMSQRLVSSNPSLSLLIASLYCALSNTSGSIFVSISCWITGAMQKTIWHDVVLKRASLCDAVLPCLL